MNRKCPRLVSFWDGSTTRWAILNARSENEIEREFPELTLYTWYPPQMVFTIKTLSEFEGEIDIDDRDASLLADIIRGRTP